MTRLNRAPSSWELPSLLDHCKTGPQIGIKEMGMTRYMPARPEGFFSLPSRAKLAWAVFCGRADALFWPGQQ